MGSHKKNKCECKQKVKVTVKFPNGQEYEGGSNMVYSQPVSIFVPSPGFLTVTNVETPITTLSITLTQESLVELRGLVGWSSPSFFEINAISPNFPELVILWRIRRGAGGPIIWESRDGVGIENGDQAYFTNSILHVDPSAGLGSVTYELTAQIDPVSSAGSTAEINGPISFVCVAYPK